MTSKGIPSSPSQIALVRDGGRSERRVPGTMELKVRQASTIRELGNALVTSGLLTLDQQARVLGLPRSTIWTIRNATHKSSGLSAHVINRILAAPRVPPLVRAKILQYVEEKAAGHYGHSKTQRRRFITNLASQLVNRTQH